MPDSVERCTWAGNDPLNIEYHDLEWGLPERNESRLFEMITLEGYTEPEKLAIAKQYLVPRQLKQNGLEDYPVSIGEGGIKIKTGNSTADAILKGLQFGDDDDDDDAEDEDDDD